LKELMTISKSTTSLAIEWINIPSGTFMMGSPTAEIDRDENEIQHLVTISAFKMSKFAVTFEQYDNFCKNTKRYKPDDEDWGRGKQPVINVSWHDAKAFASWLDCRLPTEAEWEYACRSGTTTPFNTGNNLTARQANYDGQTPYGNYSKGECRRKVIPVGYFSPNTWGLCDMHGNIFEWCSDWLGDLDTKAQTNPQGPSEGNRKVMRGGCYASSAKYCRSAYRSSGYPNQRDYCFGFRVVLLE